jgi:hypothetical protein
MNNLISWLSIHVDNNTCTARLPNWDFTYQPFFQESWILNLTIFETELEENKRQIPCLPYSSTLKMEAVKFYQAIWHYIPEDSIAQSQSTMRNQIS